MRTSWQVVATAGGLKTGLQRSAVATEDSAAAEMLEDDDDHGQKSVCQKSGSW